MSRKYDTSDPRKGSSEYSAGEDDSDEEHRQRHRDRSPLSHRDRSPLSHRDRSPLRHKDRTSRRESDEPKQKLTLVLGKKVTDQKKGIQMKLSGSVTKASVKQPSPMPKPTVASVFNADDDDDEPEEMPAEARMRMRNIGRETPTSAGPNSFGKTKQGFCDSKKIFEKTLKKAMEDANN